WLLPAFWLASIMASRNSLVFSCCSTPVNCTSCWVNWLVSSGSSGFWFLSCVVSSCRKVSKLSAMPCRVPVSAEVPVPPMPLIAMPVLLDEQVDAARRSQAAVIGGGGRGRLRLRSATRHGVAEHRMLVAGALLAPRALLAQREFEAGAGAVEAGLR